MPVYRQPGGFVRPGPSFLDCYQELTTTTSLNLVRGCYQACEGLFLVIVDFNNALNALNSNPAIPTDHPVYEDAQRLVFLLAYFVYVPLDACLQLILNYPRWYRNYTPGGEQDFVKEYEWLLNALFFIDKKLCQRLHIPSIKDRVANSNTGLPVAGVPAYGVVELLLRIVADSVRSNSVVQLQQQFRRLQLQRPRGNFELSAIPQKAFACMGAPQPAAGAPLPQIVITTSKDRWPDFTRLRFFVAVGRDTHKGYAPFQNADIDIIRVHSQSLLHLHNAGLLRQDMIDEKPLGPFFDHREEQALPMDCPGFAIAPRCLRCQVLFRYNDDFNDTLRQRERRYLYNPNAQVNKDLDCAETFAHFYCLAVHQP